MLLGCVEVRGFNCAVKYNHYIAHTKKPYHSPGDLVRMYTALLPFLLPSHCQLHPQNTQLWVGMSLEHSSYRQQAERSEAAEIWKGTHGHQPIPHSRAVTLLP